MKHFSLILGLLLTVAYTSAQTGDTLVVQAFTFDDPSPVGWSAPYRGTFQFPDTSQSFSRILMAYTLKCDSRTNHDNYACGEWDYLTYTFVYDSTGRWDSTYRTHPNFRVGGNTPDSLPLSLRPTYDLRIDAQPRATALDTLSTLTAQLGAGAHSSFELLDGQAEQRRMQYLWTADELTAAGLHSKPLTALRLYVEQAGSELQHFRVALKQVPAKDSLDAQSYEPDGFQVVYRGEAAWSSPGWQTLLFHQPFALDTTQSLLLEMTYENTHMGTATVLRGDSTAHAMGAYAVGPDGYFSLGGAAFLRPSAFALRDSIADEITITCWLYGDPAAMPANTSAFEALDSSGRRVFNAHVPWGNGRVYWDAGSENGQYDRIDKQASPSEFEGEWHHWAFVKKVSTGRMEIYLDGQLWRGGFSRFRTMAGIAEWAIGAGANSNYSFRGKIDELRVWNRALDDTTIQAWMYRDDLIFHPHYAYLIADYSFNWLTADWKAPDHSWHSGEAELVGGPRWTTHAPWQLRRNWREAALRPQVIFDQSEYVLDLDTAVLVDTLPLAPVAVSLFENDPGGLLIAEDAPNHPRVATDTLSAWLTSEPQQTFDYATRQVISTASRVADTVLRRQAIDYYSPVVRYEIGRYITPYGINLDLGPEGTMWLFDVTDYAPLLRGSVYLQAGNNQELLDLKFLMIEGKPTRSVRSIRNVWDGSFTYQSLVSDQQGAARRFRLDAQASGFAVKTRSSGHGFGGPTNCAEFCPRDHRLLVNDDQAFSWNLWNECADNHVFPQGGTWVYDRAGWCPGDVVNTYHHELSGLVAPGDSLTLDYEVDLPSGTAPEGNYVMRAQLFEYGPHRYQLDVRLDDILAPSQADRHRRYNPVCDHPIVEVSNQGRDTITSMLIRYGVEGGVSACTYSWSGNLPFGQAVVIDLPRFNWTGLDAEAPTFFADVVYVNGQVDERQENDLMRSPFALVPQQDPGTILEFRTNNAPYENSYEILDKDGQVLRSGGVFSANTVYRDTLSLAEGCYTLHFKDTGEDGIAWWANNDGSGYVRLLTPEGNLLRSFEPDYGKDIVYQFTIGYRMGEEDPDVSCADTNSVSIYAPQTAWAAAVYPNPARDHFFIDLSLPDAQSLTLRLYNAAGQLLRQEQRDRFREGVLRWASPGVPGVYFLQVQAGPEFRTLPLRIE